MSSRPVGVGSGRDEVYLSCGHVVILVGAESEDLLGEAVDCPLHPVGASNREYPTINGISVGSIDKPDAPEVQWVAISNEGRQELCHKCWKRLSRLQWAESAIMGMRGYSEGRCETCATREQLVHAFKRTVAPPGLAARFAWFGIRRK